MVGVAVRGEAVTAVLWLNTRSNINLAKLPMFNREANKVLRFLMACKLFIRMKIRNKLVEEQVQWILLYV